MNRYDYLSLIAMIAVPLAPAFFFGYAVYTAVVSLPAPSWIAVPVGVMAALGLELVGILAGHVANTAWRLGDYGRAVLGALIMAVYVVIGVMELWGSIGAVMFLIAPLVYLLAALQEGLHTAVTQREAQTAVTRQQEQNERKEQHEHNRRMELEKLRLAHDEKLARIAAKTQTVIRTEADTSKTDWRLMSDTERLRLLDFTPDEIVGRYGVSSKTAGRWLERAGDLSEKMSENGHVIG